MGFASSPFSAMPGHRLEVGSYILGATADGRITVQRTIGIRRISGPGAVGDLWLAAGTSIVPAGGSIGGTSPYSYDTTANSYNELTSGVSSLTPAEYIGSNIYRVNGRVDTEASPENPLGSAPQTSADAEFPAPSQVTQPSFTPAVFNAGDTITISLPRQNSAYTHTLYWQVGNAQPVYLDGGVGASLVFATPADEILARMTEAPEAKFSIISTTMNGSAIVGEARFEGRVLAPTSAAPTVSAYTVSDANTAASSIVGAFVQGVSTLRLDGVTAAAKDGATIVERRLSIEGAGMAIGDTRALMNSGAIPVTARAWDSRGLSGSLAGSISVLPYQGPSIALPLPSPTGSNVYRSNASGVYDPEGASLTVSYNAAVASLVNSTQRNTLTVRISTRPIDGDTWTVRNTLTPEVSILSGRLRTGNLTQVVGGGAIYSPDQSYIVRVEVLDRFNTLVKEETVATAYITIDLNGRSVGVGKLRQRGTLDVAGRAYFEGLSYQDWMVGDLNAAAFGGTYSFEEGAANSPPISTIIGRLVVSRIPGPDGFDFITQQVVDIKYGNVLHVRTGGAIAGGDAVGWDGPWSYMGQVIPSVGTNAQRLTASANVDGRKFYCTDTQLEWIWREGTWFLTPGQVLDSMTGPAANGGGADVLIGSRITTPVLPVGQRVKIFSNFSQYSTIPGVSLVNTLWRNDGSDVSPAGGSYVGSARSRAYGASSAQVVGGRGANALFTATNAARVSVGIFTGNATSMVYGVDGTFLWVESA